jgi:DNA-binding SARP family transcriptional activator
LEISVEGRPLHLAGAQIPRLLSLLALHNGSSVRLESIIDVIWADAPPAQARRVALNLVGRLRQTVGRDSTLTRQGTVSLVDAATDLDEFHALRTDADRHHRRGDAANERSCLAAAIRLVRGTPFAGWEDDPFFGPESIGLQRTIDRVRLRESRLALVEGDHDAAREGAEAVLSRDPLSQDALGVLMSALAATGRIREALAAYQDAKQLLAEETGLDPDPGLTAQYADVLRLEPGDAPERTPAPRQLPRIADHVPAHSKERSIALEAFAASDAASPTIVAVSGRGGIGKSAFALELAHSLKDRYPDGQLFTDLQGNSPGSDPLDADRVVRHFLRSLGHGHIEWQTVDEGAAHFRSVTTDLRVLIVLDDARDLAQIRPLLPNGPHCAVIVTSRHALSSLRGAKHLELSLLDTATSRDLFRAGVDHPFTADDEASLDGVVERCGGLPLALTIAAARFNTAEPGSLAGILASLADESLRLSSFDDGENSLAASLTGSLEALASTPAGRQAVELFTMLALHPGSSVSVEIAAALADEPIPTVRQLGELLHRYHLAYLHSDGRFSMHDLVRLFAGAEAARLDPDTTRAAIKRMQSAYLATAAQTYRLYREHVHTPVGRNRLEFVSGLPDAPVDFSSLRAADDWLVDHIPVFAELTRTAGRADLHFAGLLFMLINPQVRARAGLIRELLNIGMTAVEVLGPDDGPWGVYLHHDLAEMQSSLGDHGSALRSLDNAEASARRHSRIAEAVGVSVTRVRTLQRFGEVDQALALADKALVEARHQGLNDIIARASAFRSYLLDLRGEHDAAIEQSAMLVEFTGDPSTGATPMDHANSMTTHAFRLIHGGRAAEGLEFAERSGAVYKAHGFGRSLNYAEILWGQAEAHQALGNGALAERLRHETARLLLDNGQVDQAEYEEILAGKRPAIDPAG